jgi:FHS family L-fucose permease-like MFS transporter
LQYVENYLKENPETVSTAAATAGAVSGVYWLLMLVGRLIGGAVGGKVSSRAMLAFVAIVGLVFLALAINLPESITVDMFGIDKENGFEITTVVLPISVLFLILCGLCTSVMWGAIFNLSVSGLGKYTQVASGIFMVMVCGGGIWPFIQSLIVGDGGLSSYLSSFWLVFALVAYQLFYALVGSRVKKA